jgi:hypothetical protein
MPEEGAETATNADGMVTVTAAPESASPKVRRPRRDIVESDNDFVTGVRTIRVALYKMGKDGQLPESAVATARALLQKDPTLSARVGGEDSIRRLLARDHTRAKRLSDEGRIDLNFLDDFPGYLGQIGKQEKLSS